MVVVLRLFAAGEIAPDGNLGDSNARRGYFPRISIRRIEAVNISLDLSGNVRCRKAAADIEFPVFPIGSSTPASRTSLPLL